MRKLFTGVLALLLAASMYFAVAPLSYAGEPSSPDLESQPQENPALLAPLPAVSFANTAAPQEEANSSGQQLTNEDDSFAASVQGSLESNGASDQDLEPTDSDATSADNAVTSTLNSEQGMLGAQGRDNDRDNDHHNSNDHGNGNNSGNSNNNDHNNGTSHENDNDPDRDENKPSFELSVALDSLRDLLKGEHGATITRTDNALLSKDNLHAQFYGRLSSARVTTLIEQINRLLIECGLAKEHSGPSYPLSVVGGLPRGFSFSNGTLTLTDTDLLSWNASLGDKEDTRTRSYEITLRLTTGIPYLDAFLSLVSRSGLATETFTIDLQLINLPNGGSNPGGNGGGTGVNPGDDDASDNSGDVGMSDSAPPPTVSPVFILTEPLVSLPVTSEPANEEALPVASAEEPEAAANQLSPDLTIEELQIPMASMMVDDNGNVVVANVGLAALSLSAGAASLVSLRPRKPRFPQAVSATPPLGPVGNALGIVSIGLGATSLVLLILSQSLSSSLQESDIAWTPFLITIVVFQATCSVGLFVSKRLAKKTVGKPRYKIRY